MEAKQVAIWLFYIVALIFFCGLGIFFVIGGGFVSSLAGAMMFFGSLAVFGMPMYKEFKKSRKI
ncbi:hypothetical protein KY338_04745 [Candidatus Woesearchaeota archaeon]|nr:hypothetical protein [Candidatus Woesearchaeota archaeon]MBW3006214.1 hypothetical protein [Candidatus Woesearchaeota archaeon]